MTAICRKDSPLTTLSDPALPPKPLSDAQRMRKAIMELVETERAYVKVRSRIYIISFLQFWH